MVYIKVENKEKTDDEANLKIIYSDSFKLLNRDVPNKIARFLQLRPISGFLLGLGIFTGSQEPEPK